MTDNTDESADEPSDGSTESTDREDWEPREDGWMAPVDDDILELMRDPDAFEPSDVDDAGICRGPDAAYRCRELAKYGLLEKLAIGMYDITDRGERYLEGEVDPDDLEPEDD
ncbi:hypothetical protein [Natronolimnohabitans innermongolicus]|uniref:PhiH1 repressor-like protein n=1 Tax=Natronolimnohabitans innermongolicus JCM 12255 TaxID=1227499 RepID=L9WHC6_9EURY|nr:hypothetical protein [Natronolimnohabitans innermongolicus]ELY48757.1 hypothetical protein C493_21766 [Natronolimnohabitans innermongolicus JCM 12255]